MSGISHSSFLSSDISTTSSSLLLSSGCSLFSLHEQLLPRYPFSFTPFFPLLTLFLNHNLTELRRESRQWLVPKQWFSILSLSSASLPFGSSCSEILSGKGKGELLFCEIRLDRVTPPSHLLSKASFPTIDIFAPWLHWEYIHKVSKSSIWYRKKAYIGWAFHIISANLPFPYFYSLQFNYKSVYCYHHHTALFECVSLSLPG